MHILTEEFTNFISLFFNKLFDEEMRTYLFDRTCFMRKLKF